MGLTMGHYGLKHVRARLAGDQIELGRQKQKLLSSIADLTLQVMALDAQMQDKAMQIEALDTALQTVFDDQSPVEPRQTFPKKHIFKWGGLTRGALAILRAAKGLELTTVQIAEALAEQAGLELSTYPDGRGFRRAIRQRLAYLSKKGVIERLHAQQTSKDGQWRLKGTHE